MENINLSVAVLHYNNPELTRQCVNAIAPQLPNDCEFFVVDNGSDISGRFRPPPFVYCYKDNSGNIGGQNRCFEHATREYVLFVSNDVRLESNCVNELLAVAQDYPDFGQIQPVLWRPNTLDIDNSGMRYWWPGYGVGLTDIPGKTRRTPLIASICYLMRKSVWKKMGGFDETLPSAYEDVDMGLRLHKAGFKSYVASNARATHQANSTLRYLPKVKERFHCARIQVVKKNFTGPGRLARLAAVHLLDRINNTWNSLRK